MTLYPVFPNASFLFCFVFSGGNISYTNLVVMIRSLRTSIRVGVFSQPKLHSLHVLKFTFHSIRIITITKHLEDSYMPIYNGRGDIIGKKNNISKILELMWTFLSAVWL